MIVLVANPSPRNPILQKQIVRLVEALEIQDKDVARNQLSRMSTWAVWEGVIRRAAQSEIMNYNQKGVNPMSQQSMPILTLSTFADGAVTANVVGQR